MVTLDLQVLGQRHKDLKNGLSSPPRLTLPNIIDMMLHARWSLGMLGTPRRTFGNIVGHARNVKTIAQVSEWVNGRYDPHLDWNKVVRLRDRWGGKFVLKGINDAEDARMAVDAGADAIVVSNHGGRQLDGAPSTIRQLPAIRAAVGEGVELWLDSGIRSGQDVLKALGLGADAAMIGRAYVHGLGAMGEAGVTRALEVIRDEMDITLALCGERRTRDFTREHLLVPQGFTHGWA